MPTLQETYRSSAIIVTGGTMDGVVIGGTTPAAGTFTGVGIGGAPVTDFPLTAYQTADAKGWKVFGAGDQSAEYIECYIQSTGFPRITGSAGLQLQAAAGNLNYYALSGSVAYNIAGTWAVVDSDGGYATRVTIDSAAAPATGRLVIPEDLATSIVMGATNDSRIGYVDSTGLTFYDNVYGATRTLVELANIVYDTTPELGGNLSAGEKTIYFTLGTYTPAAGNSDTVTVDLTTHQHPMIDASTSTGACTITLTPPTGVGLGVITLLQHSTPRDFTWIVTGGTAKWHTDAPSTGDTASNYYQISYKWDGALMFLSSTAGVA